MSTDNIHPIFDELVQRQQREKRSQHRGLVVWLTGLSGSGKSTIAAAAERRLFDKGYQVRVLDGDNVRSGLNSDLEFSLADRTESNRRVAELAKLFVQTGFVTLCSFVSPTKAMRDTAREIIGDEDLVIVYVAADLATCEQRDVKGLYAKARSGDLKGFTGIDSPYEEPEEPELEINTADETVDASAKTLVEYIIERVGQINSEK